MDTILPTLLISAPLLLLWFPLRASWKCWRTHRRFKAATQDCDAAIVMLSKSKTYEELQVRSARVDECLENMDAVRKE